MTKGLADGKASPLVLCLLYSLLAEAIGTQRVKILAPARVDPLVSVARLDPGRGRLGRTPVLSVQRPPSAGGRLRTGGR